MKRKEVELTNEQEKELEYYERKLKLEALYHKKQRRDDLEVEKEFLLFKESLRKG